MYKRAFHEKRHHNTETNKLTNRQGEKVILITRIRQNGRAGGSNWVWF